LHYNTIGIGHCIGKDVFALCFIHGGVCLQRECVIWNSWIGRAIGYVKYLFPKTVNTPTSQTCSSLLSTEGLWDSGLTKTLSLLDETLYSRDQYGS
jgi:hypothetical protein